MSTNEENRDELLKLDKLEKLSKISAAIAIPIILAVGGWIIQARMQSSQLDHDYVKLAVDILREDNDSNDEAMRKWAVDLLNDHSSVKFPDEARDSLISGKTTLPRPATIRENIEIPEYDLPQPKFKGSLSSLQQKLLVAALGEINADVHEAASYERVGKYWHSLGMNVDGRDRGMPWNAAFLSWVIAQSGNPNKLKLSAAVAKIWTDAVVKGLSFIPGEKKPMPGDLVFFLRGLSEGSENIEIARTGKLASFKGHCGIVYEAFDESFLSIEGNVRNGIHLVKHTYDDNRLIGFVRLTE